jgi:hypothetical protein
MSPIAIAAWGFLGFLVLIALFALIRWPFVLRQGEMEPAHRWSAALRRNKPERPEDYD